MNLKEKGQLDPLDDTREGVTKIVNHTAFAQPVRLTPPHINYDQITSKGK
ncbi:hypothetical protein Plhal304r1_c002g0005391 [Plasmopara halstedii]